METKLTDPVFGDMLFDEFWEANNVVNGLGENVAIQIDGIAPPSLSQQNRFVNLRNNYGALKPAIQDAVFKYYIRVREEYVIMYAGTPMMECIPEIGNPADIWLLLSDPCIYVPRDDDYLTISWASEWDDEHGLEVKIENETVIAVDIQGGF